MAPGPSFRGPGAEFRIFLVWGGGRELHIEYDIASSSPGRRTNPHVFLLLLFSQASIEVGLGC